MRILVCASAAPLEPLDGLRLQIAQLCRHLARRSEVSVLAYRWPEQTGAAPPGVELMALDAPSRRPLPRLAGWARASVSPQPLEVVRAAPRMRSELGRLLERRSFD